MKLKNQVAIITGANRGLGEAIARAYWSEGANLVLAARDSQPLQVVAESLPAQAGQSLAWLSADVGTREGVEAIIRRATEQFGRVDILVNNAGVYGPIGLIEEIDWEAWCQALQINLVGVVGMTRAVIPAMKQQGKGKIINLSGGGATSPMPRFSLYAASKAAVVRFTETMAHELADFGIDVNAVAPGALNTRILEQVLEAGPERAGADFYKRSLQQQESGGASLENAAELIVYLASAQSDGISGRLLSAVWDDWRNLAEQCEKLKNSDVYTLRRIVPADRGWEEQA